MKYKASDPILMTWHKIQLIPFDYGHYKSIQMNIISPEGELISAIDFNAQKVCELRAKLKAMCKSLKIVEEPTK